MVTLSDRWKQAFLILGFSLFVVPPSLVLGFFIFFRDLVLEFCALVKSRVLVSRTEQAERYKKEEGMSLKEDVSKALLNSSVSFSGDPLKADPYSRDDHLFGIPRRIVLSTVGAFSFIVTSVLNRTRVHNLETLKRLIHSRGNVPLLTVSNHMSTLDDPLMWGIRGLRATRAKVCRWTLTAKDVCFTNSLHSYFFRVGKSIPIIRGGGINQDYMFEAIEKINQGEWLHTFPQGKVLQENGPLDRLKWGVASIIARASSNPIIVCIGHSGFEKVMPEKHLFGRRALLPLWFNNIQIVVSEPMQFDVATLRRQAEEAVLNNDPEFGSDALLSEENELSEGRDLEAGMAGKESEMEKEKQKKWNTSSIGIVERRLYAEISSRIKKELEKVVLQAQAYNCNQR